MSSRCALNHVRAICLILAGLVSWSGAQAETLADTLVSAYKNSGLLEQNRALLRAADEDVAVAISRLRPIVNWSSRMSYIYDRGQDSFDREFETEQGDFSLGLTAEWLLYDFGRSAAQIEATKETVLATRQKLRAIEQDVLFRAMRAHVDVLRARENVALRRNSLGVIRRELYAAQERFRIGEATQTDIFQAEARLAAARSGLATAEQDLEIAVEDYTVAVGRMPGTLQPVSRMPDLDMTEEAAKAVALSSHPWIMEIRHRVRAADLGIEAARKAKRPTVNLTGRIGLEEEISSGSDFGRSGEIGVEISGPIYQGGRLTALMRQASARHDAARGELHTVSLQVAQNVGNAFARMRAAAMALTSSREEVRAAELAFEGVQSEARFGTRTTLDVLQSEQILLSARTNRITARANLQIAAYNALASLGQLTATDLNLDVPVYNPEAYYNLSRHAPVSISPRGRKLDRIIETLGK